MAPKHNYSSKRHSRIPQEDLTGTHLRLDAIHEVGQGLRGDAKIWEMYVEEAGKHDTALLQGWNDSLDVLLILAGLFSAVLTAFVVDSYKLLEPDPQGDATVLLTQVVQRLDSLLHINDSTASFPNAISLLSLPSQTFQPPAYSWWLNVMWFSSLVCSLSAAFIAMLVKQWLHAYTLHRPGRVEMRARQRHFRYSGLLKWKVSAMISILPALLQLGFGLFFAGLNVLLWSINRPIAYFMMTLTGLLLAFYSVTAVAPLFDSACPFKTPFTSTLRSHIRRTYCIGGVLVDYIRAIFTTGKVHFPKGSPSFQRRLKETATSHPELEQIDINQSHHAINLGVVEWLIANSHDHEIVDTALKAIASIRPDFNPTPNLRDSGAIHLLVDRLDPKISDNSIAPTVAFRSHAADSIPYLASMLCSLRHCTQKDIAHIASDFHWRAWIVSWGDFTLEQLISDGWNVDALALYLCASTHCDRAQGRRANREFKVMLELLNRHSNGNRGMCNFSVWALVDSIALWGAEFENVSMESTRPAVVACLIRLLTLPYAMGDPVTCAISVALGVFVLDLRGNSIAKYQDEEKRQQDAHVLLIRGVVEIMKETPGLHLRYALNEHDFEAGGMVICKLLIENNVPSWSTGISAALVTVLTFSKTEALVCRVLETFRRLLSFDSQSTVPYLPSVIVSLLENNTSLSVQVKATQVIGELMHWRDHRESVLARGGVQPLVRNLKSPDEDLSNASSLALLDLARDIRARDVMVNLGLAEALTTFFVSGNASHQNLACWSWTFVGSSWTEMREHCDGVNRFQTTFRELSQVLESSMRHGEGLDNNGPFTPTRRRDLQRILQRLKQLSEREEEDDEEFVCGGNYVVLESRIPYYRSRPSGER